MNDRKTFFVWQKRNNAFENWQRYWGNRRQYTASILKLVKAMKLSIKCLIGLPDICSVEYYLCLLPKDRQTSTVDCAHMGSKVQEGMFLQFLTNQQDWRDSTPINGF